jgi:hypothetical protein
MSGFTRRAKGLEVTFPLSGMQGHEPGDVSEHVQLVHPLFGPLQRIGSGERTRVTVAGAAGITSIDLVTAPTGLVRVVEYAEAQHDDIAPRTLSFHVVLFGVAASETCMQSSLFDGSAALVASLDDYPLHRSVVLGPGDVFRVRGAVAAGFILSGRALVCDYSPADVARI